MHQSVKITKQRPVKVKVSIFTKNLHFFYFGELQQNWWN